MKKFKPLYTFASLWKQFVLFTKNWRRKPTGELVNKDKLELEDVTANDIEVRDIKCRKVTATGEIKTSSKITATGVVKGSSFDGDTSFETIKDRDGHLRFIEGDITIETIEGISQSYGKWSLSGSHLMIVLALSVENALVFSTGNVAIISDIPSWVMDKIVALTGSTVIPYVNFTFVGGGTTQALAAQLLKSSDNLYIQMYSFTSTGNRSGRIQFDLVIDNAESE